MINLVAFFVQRFVLAISIFLAIFLFGLVGFLNTGISLLPEVDIPVVSVSTAYPGASPTEVVDQISEPIESALTSLEGLNTISSTSSEGFSLVVVEFTSGTDPDEAATDVNQQVSAIVNTLPGNAETPSVDTFDPNDQPILDVAIAAAGASLSAVQTFVEDEVELALQRTEGVADISIISPVEQQVEVLLDPAVLSGFNLSPQAVANAIRSFAVTVPAGDLRVGEERILLIGRNTPSNLAQVEEIPVDSARGLRVRDVAVVRDTTTDQESFTRLNGAPVVTLEVRKRSGANSVETAQRVRETLAGLDLPETYTAEIIGDETTFIANTVSATSSQIFLVVFIVAFVVLIFVGNLGAVFSVMLAVPISLAGALIFFNLLGFTFNIITLLAITVAIGIVVDDSIVIAENITRLRERGLRGREAVIQGAGEVSAAVLASTLSLLAVFLPISFLPGQIGEFFSQFGLTLAFTIVFSYLEALFFLTVRMAYLPNPLPPTWSQLGGAASRIGADARVILSALSRVWFWVLFAAFAAGLYFAGPNLFSLGVPSFVYPLGALLLPLALFLGLYLGRLLLFFVGAIARTCYEGGNWLITKLRSGYGSLLNVLLSNAVFVMIGAAALFASLFFVAPRLGFNFTPPIDSGQLSVSLELPPGTSLTETNRVAGNVEQALLSDPLVTQVLATIGAQGSNQGLATGNANAERAEFLVELVGKDERPKQTGALAVDFEGKLEEVLADEVNVDLNVSAAQQAGPPGTAEYQLDLGSSDLEALRERTDAALAVLQDTPGLRNPEASLSETVSEQVFVINTSELISAGLSVEEVYGTLRAYNVGLDAAQVRREGEEFPILVRANPRVLADQQALLSLPVFPQGGGGSVQLGTLGRFESREAPSAISRTNQTFSAALTASTAPDGPPLSVVRANVEQTLQREGLLDGRVSLLTEGTDLTGDLQRVAPIAFGLALLLNYLVIASQFNTFRYPLYILLSVPLALVGAMWLFYITGTALDINSVLGFVILIGLVTKTAILLLDVVQSRQQEGVDLREALLEAGKLRFRPILMTTLTVIVIGLPLLFGGGEGSEFRRPLGLVILGGVVSSSLLTLFVVPAAFYLFERGRFEKEETQQTGVKGELRGVSTD